MIGFPKNIKAFPSVTITFPNFNGGKEPIDCLKSIRKLNYPKEKLQIIVVDNHSIDGSFENIKKKFPETVFIRNTKNLGFAKAVNQAIKMARGEYLFITNDDIIFEKNSLKNLIEYSLKNPQTGVLGGKIYQKANPKKIASAGYLMNKWTGNIYSAKNPNKIKDPDWIPGCTMLISKKTLKMVGLLDDNFTYSFEDYDYCLRVKKLGLRIIYLPTAIFWHGESVTANKNLNLKHVQWYQSKLRFIIKNIPIVNIVSILFLQIFLFTPYKAIVLRDGRFVPFIKGLAWNIKNIGQTLQARKQTT